MNDLMNTQRVALITGASGGFGLRCCAEFLRRGYSVIAATRDEAAFHERWQKWTKQPPPSSVMAIALDPSEPEQMSETLSELCQRLQRIDVLVNNAGFACGGFVEDVPLQAWRQQMEVNFFGVVAATQAVLPFMRQQGSGKIINMSSISGVIGMPGYGPYASSKFALEGFSEALRHEVKAHGIHVVLIEPGAYKTSIWQRGFEQMYAPEDSAYGDQLASVLRFTRASAERAGDPTEVAELVAHVAAHPRPRLRYMAGRGAKWTMRLKKRLPWSVWETILNRILS